MTSIAQLLELAPRLLVRGSSLEDSPAAVDAGGPSWSPEVTRGRLVELSAGPGGAPLTAACMLVRRYQAIGEPVGWVCGRADGRTLYPPDAAAAGVALAHLPVVMLRNVTQALRAACHLVRAGGFGAVVADLGRVDEHIPQALLARLGKIAQRQQAAVLLLTHKPPEVASMGSLVSLRIAARLQADASGRFAVQLRAIKDKLRQPGWVDTEIVVGPPGLR